MTDKTLSIGVVIPCYKVAEHLPGVVSRVGAEVTRIYIVDDCCPDGSVDRFRSNCVDSRVRFLKNQQNLGVGGAVLRGYEEAILEGLDIVVKIDGDGQMDPELLGGFIWPIIQGQADYTKGNRFYDIAGLAGMPFLRVLGNATLSLFSKLSSGYWNLFDPTNGYTAIHVDVLRLLPLSKISKDYFFESDMLFRLNTIRAAVIDIPMKAVYQEEVSNLKISSIFMPFIFKHLKNSVKRVIYNYFLRDMSVASFELLIGCFMLGFGLFYGAIEWGASMRTEIPATAGKVMLSALPLILGMQLFLSFLSYDVYATPSRPIHSRRLLEQAAFSGPQN